MTNQPPWPVTIVAFEIIEQCNFYCDFCVRNAHSKLTSKVSEVAFQKRLDSIIHSFPSLSHIALTGGEPFLHPKLVDMARHATNSRRSVSITTNASIRNRTTLSELSALKSVHLIVSLDGPNPRLHDEIRGFPGAFARVQEFTAACREESLPFSVNVTVNEHNVSGVLDTICAAASFGATDVSVALVKPEGRGNCSSAPTTDILASVARQVERAKSLLYGRIGVRFTEPLAHIIDVRLAEGDGVRTCGASGTTLHVRCNGDVLICTSCTQSLGNLDILGEQISDSWRHDSRLSAIRDSRLGGVCASCDLVRRCGGCRCRAEKAGDFLGHDPLCPKSVAKRNELAAADARAFAEGRTRVEAATDPEGLRQWLLGWNSAPLDRHNSDFEAQRSWGHNYTVDDASYLPGEMGNRHLDILERFIASGELPPRLEGYRVLDIGCWTGGEAHLMAALGAHVDVVEEHPTYLEATLHVAQALELRVFSAGHSAYEIGHGYTGVYDIVYLSGVISHVSDPITLLRIAFNSLKLDGACLLETQTSYAADGRDEFWGYGRPGWVWWNLSRPTLLEMLYQCGFSKVSIIDFGKNRRLQLSARKGINSPMQMRMGLVRKDL